MFKHLCATMEVELIFNLKRKSIENMGITIGYSVPKKRLLKNERSIRICVNDTRNKHLKLSSRKCIASKTFPTALHNDIGILGRGKKQIKRRPIRFRKVNSKCWRENHVESDNAISRRMTMSTGRILSTPHQEDLDAELAAHIGQLNVSPKAMSTGRSLLRKQMVNELAACLAQLDVSRESKLPIQNNFAGVVRYIRSSLPPKELDARLAAFIGQLNISPQDLMELTIERMLSLQLINVYYYSCLL